MKSFDNHKAKKNLNKSPNEYNFPFQNNSNLSKSKVEEGGRRSVMFDEHPKDEPTSRSGSIQGRKLSFCDHHITVSQNTIETSSIPVNQGLSYREESQISYMGNGRVTYQSFAAHSSLHESNVKGKGEVWNMHSQARGHNPRQSKDASKKHKKRQPQISHSSKVQQQIRQHMKSQQSLRNNSRSPLRERRDTNPYGNYNDSKSHNKSNCKVKQNSFLLTFNRDKEDHSPHDLKKKKSNTKSSRGKENLKVVSYEGGIVSIDNKENRLRQEEENRLKKLLISTSSAKKQKKKGKLEKKYHSPSPQSKQQSTPYQQYTNKDKNCNKDLKFAFNMLSDINSNTKSHVESPEKDSPNRKSIDRLVKDNIKKKVEQEKKQKEEIQIRKEQESQRRKNIDSQNKKIREENLKKSLIKINKNKIQQVQKTIEYDEKPPKFVIKNKNSSPLKVAHQKNKESFLKNKDMPMKIEKRNKEQLGLEIFEVKKELGMKIHQNMSTVEQPSYRQKSKTPKPSDMLTEEFHKHKHIQPNPKLQKLISQQQRERLKKEKKQKLKDMKKQFKIIENLKNLNKVCSEQSKSFKKKLPSNQQRSQQNYFKTAQEELYQFQIEQEQKKTLERSRSNERPINIDIPFQRPVKKSPQKSKSPVKSQYSVSNRRQTLQAQNKEKEIVLPRQIPRPESKQSHTKNRILYSHVSSQHHHNSQHHQQNLSQQRIGGGQKSSNHNSHSSLGKKKKTHPKKKIIDVLIEQMQKKADSINHSHLIPQTQQSKRSKKNKSSSRVQNHQKLIDSPQTKFLYQNQRQIASQTPTNPSINAAQQQKLKGMSTKSSDNIIIQDDLIIFFLMNTAAQVIQTNFREYMRRKKEKQNVFIRNEQDDKTLTFQKATTSQNETPSLKDSAMLEQRLKPINEDLQKKSQESQQQYTFAEQPPKEEEGKKKQRGQKKQVQHTFSFGDIDKSHLQKNPLQKQQNQVFEIAQENRIISQIESNRRKQDSIREEKPEQRIIQKKEFDKFQQLRNVAEKQKNINNIFVIKKQLDTISKENTQKEFRPISVIENQKRTGRQSSQEEIKEVPHQIQSSSKQSVIVLDQDPFYNDSEDYKNFLLEREKEEKKQGVNKSKQSYSDYETNKKSSKAELIQKLNELSNFSMEIENDPDFSQPLNDDQDQLKDQFNNESRVSISIDEQTDKLIQQSPLNTNEALLEKAVNQSNNYVEDSLIIGDSNLLSGKIDDYQDKLPQIISSEKSFKHQKQNLLDQSREEEVFRAFRSENESHSNTDGEQQRNSRPSKVESLEQQKPLLRLMFGDEKFLLEQNNQAYPLSMEGSHIGSGSAPSSHRQYQQSENPYFLQTNASIFERNPFKDFTTNRLHEVLQGKEFKELIDIKEDALKFQEKIEKGMINRMEKKLELSPKSVQKRKYEFESWVSSERKENERRKQKDQPINITELEQARIEAMQIIEQSNKKAKEYKSQLEKKKQVINVESNQYPGEEQSMSKIDISQEIEIIDQQEQKYQQDREFSRMPEIIDEEKIDSFHEKKDTENDKINLSLDISFEEEDSFIVPQKKDSEKKVDPQSEIDVEELTQQIFKELLQKESLNLFPIRQIQEITSPKSEEKKDEQKIPQGSERFIQEKSPIVKIQPFSEQQLFDNTSQSSKQGGQGIDTSENAIEEYIEEIFTQIRARSGDFMNAFSTPILRDPLDILSQIQRPDSGEGDQSLDLTNSLTCILNVQLYLTLEKARENLIHEAINQIKKQSIQSDQEQYTDEELIDQITEAQHIHNKIIFDSINEALNLVRPYQSAGLPMPWSRKQRKKLDNFKNAPDVQLEIILKKVKSMILNWAKTRAGPLINKEHFGDEENQIQLKEKRLAQLLSFDLMESEKKWLDYETEETQVKIDLSDIILEHLIGETCTVLNEIEEKREKRTF